MYAAMELGLAMAPPSILHQEAEGRSSRQSTRLWLGGTPFGRLHIFDAQS